MISAPQKTDRAALNQLVRDYAVKCRINHNAVFGRVYREMYYRLGVDVKTRARNRGQSVIEWIEANGYIGQALAIAAEILR